MTGIKGKYVSSHKRLGILAKKFGLRVFHTTEVVNDVVFLRDKMVFSSGYASYQVWISRMCKEGKLFRVSKGAYTLKNDLVRSGPVNKIEVAPAKKEALPAQLMLSKSDYQLLSWLVERMEYLNGRASRVADRNRPSWAKEEEWQDFVTQMLDWHILKLLEDKEGERTFVIDVERCRDAFCLAQTKPLNPVETLFHKRNHLQSRRELLVTELVELDEQITKLQERRLAIQVGLVEAEEKAAKIDSYFNSSELQDILQD